MTPDARARRLSAAVNRLRAAGHSTATAVDLAPATAYEALTRQLVDGLAEELDKLRGRVDEELHIADRGHGL